jgi:two-component system, sensor histidine kinase and response regulator
MREMTEIAVDRKALLESMENDSELLHTVIGIFLADYPGTFAAIRAGVTALDPRKVMNASHALKGSVGVFGAKRAVEAAHILESMGELNKLEGVREALCVLEHEMDPVLAVLREIANVGGMPRSRLY